MSLDSLLDAISNFTGALTPALVLTVFLITFIGEFGFSIPYLLETIWLLSGYHVANGTLIPFHFLIIFLSAEAGRLSGTLGLYFVSRIGSLPLISLYRRMFGATAIRAGAQPPLAEQITNWQGWTPWRFVRRINYYSPFSVAVGRLMWMRIPLTLTLAVKRRWKTLMIGVLISSAVWDSTYIILGLIGKNVAPRPTQMVLFSLVGLTLLYGMTVLLRLLRRQRRSA